MGCSPPGLHPAKPLFDRWTPSTSPSGLVTGGNDQEQVRRLADGQGNEQAAWNEVFYGLAAVLVDAFPVFWRRRADFSAAPSSPISPAAGCEGRAAVRQLNDHADFQPLRVD